MKQPVVEHAGGLVSVDLFDRQHRRVLALDTKDDRREIHVSLLSRLHPRSRVAFFERCCRAAVLPNSAVRPRVGKDTYRLLKLAMRDDAADLALTNDIYMSLWHLSIQYDFSLDKALALLVRMAKKQG
jgi:hypothetical protein